MKAFVWCLLTISVFTILHVSSVVLSTGVIFISVLENFKFILLLTSQGIRIGTDLVIGKFMFFYPLTFINYRPNMTVQACV